MRISRLLLLINLGFIFFSGYGCSQGPIPKDSELEFEKLRVAHIKYIESPPMIAVITDNTSLAEWFAPPYFYERPEPTIPLVWKPLQIDFSEYIIIAAFSHFLGTSGTMLNLTDVWQEENTVIVRVQISQHQYGTAYMASPVQVALVKRAELRHYGELTFKLVDDYENEMAVTTITIPPPQSSPR